MQRPIAGVLVPTAGRPDLLRACVLQFAAQSRPPDIVCVHQNGEGPDYRWATADLRLPFRLDWMHTPARIRQHEWYAIPLQHLLGVGCTHFFWADHDDLYLRDHVAAGLAELADWDFSVSRRAGVLYTQPRDWRLDADTEFHSHAPGGMSSTMCFQRGFAQALLEDLRADTTHHYADNVVAKVTMPKFRCLSSERRTCIYHSHEGSVSSSGWIPEAFGSPGHSRGGGNPERPPS
jgi:hypothetical protein